MLKSYKAVYNHGNVEWIDDPPDFEYTPILIVVEEPGTTGLDKGVVLDSDCNGDLLATILDQWLPESRSKVAAKFGDPLLWQEQERQDRPQPGREES